MSDAMPQSNWINVGILFVTALTGMLAWWGARKSARDALASQQKAGDAASRSASAAEDAARSQQRMVELEERRDEEAALDARRAVLHAEITRKTAHASGKPREDLYLTLFNLGRSTATQLAILVNQKPFKDYPEFMTELSPTASVGPNGRLDLLMSLFMGGELRLPFDVELAWDDDLGSHDNWVGTVS